MDESVVLRHAFMEYAKDISPNGKIWRLIIREKSEKVENKLFWRE